MMPAASVTPATAVALATTVTPTTSMMTSTAVTPEEAAHEFCGDSQKIFKMAKKIIPLMRSLSLT
jgi:hypothetical protein